MKEENVDEEGGERGGRMEEEGVEKKKKNKEIEIRVTEKSP